MARPIFSRDPAEMSVVMDADDEGSDSPLSTDVRSCCDSLDLAYSGEMLSPETSLAESLHEKTSACSVASVLTRAVTGMACGLCDPRSLV